MYSEKKRDGNYISFISFRINVVIATVK